MSAPIADAPPPYGTLVFDCDSTLSAIEGVDELCDLTGTPRAEIEAMTMRAMDGVVALESIYRSRLERLAPDRAALEALGRLYVEHALPHARELMEALSELGKRIFVVSGGLRQPVCALARHLGLADEQVHAVEVFLSRSGAWSGWDELSPLARGGGKLEVLRELARSDRGGGLAFVGDGVTDLEAAPAARRFVAFAGVAERANVVARASVVCRARDLAALLPLLCTAEELERLGDSPRHQALLRAAGAFR